MAAELTLGDEPGTLKVVLTRRGWGVTVRIKAGSDFTWPDGTLIDLVFTHRGQVITWPATVTPTEFSWSKTAVQAAAVPHGADAEIVLTLPGTEPYSWYDGAAVRR
jgi:hypothetical protein